MFATFLKSLGLLFKSSLLIKVEHGKLQGKAGLVGMLLSFFRWSSSGGYRQYRLFSFPIRG
jgi:hypothetical protein